MSETRSLQDILIDLQATFESASSADQQEALSQTYEVGMAACNPGSSREHLEAHYDLLESPPLQQEFIRGANRTLSSIEPVDPELASELRDFINEKYVL